ncbi:hypothetical protein PIB30_063241 [Stylosanthes scabra]|uniref:Uncharacterized protein n=1 Tax=Stylosanthes scabra TaxID=79078 RepID=A0ABU6WM30_9FABA|nr:hypothetical protein [Stylosanthes scabra]
MSQLAMKKLIFIDLTKDSESEGRSKEENPERKLANTLRRMIRLRELDSADSDLGLPSSPSSSSEEDDVLGNDLGFWNYDDLDEWGAAKLVASSEASCTSHPPPNCVGAGRLGMARHDAAPLSCCLATPRRCHGHLGVGAEVLPYARA